MGGKPLGFHMVDFPSLLHITLKLWVGPHSYSLWLSCYPQRTIGLNHQNITHGIKAGQLYSISSQPFPKNGKIVLLSYLAYYVNILKTDHMGGKHRKYVWSKWSCVCGGGWGSVVKPMFCLLPSRQSVGTWAWTDETEINGSHVKPQFDLEPVQGEAV